MWSPRLTQAFDFAAHLHRSQLRKGGRIPYLSHLLGVAALVLENGGDEDLVMAAFLHDAAEDQGGRAVLDSIREAFGPRVAGVVEGCSDTMLDPKPPWKQRKEHHLRSLQLAASDVLLVSAADKLHNLRTILSDYRILGECLWPRFRGGRDEIIWYYGAIIPLFSGPALERLAAELRTVLDQLVSEVRNHNGNDGNG